MGFCLLFKRDRVVCFAGSDRLPRVPVGSGALSGGACGFSYLLSLSLNDYSVHLGQGLSICKPLSGGKAHTELAAVTTSFRPRNNRSCSFVMAF